MHTESGGSQTEVATTQRDIADIAVHDTTARADAEVLRRESEELKGALKVLEAELRSLKEAAFVAEQQKRAQDFLDLEVGQLKERLRNEELKAYNLRKVADSGPASTLELERMRLELELANNRLAERDAALRQMNDELVAGRVAKFEANFLRSQIETLNNKLERAEAAIAREREVQALALRDASEMRLHSNQEQIFLSQQLDRLKHEKFALERALSERDHMLNTLQATFNDRRYRDMQERQPSLKEIEFLTRRIGRVEPAGDLNAGERARLTEALELETRQQALLAEEKNALNQLLTEKEQGLVAAQVSLEKMQVELREQYGLVQKERTTLQEEIESRSQQQAQLAEEKASLSQLLAEREQELAATQASLDKAQMELREQYSLAEKERSTFRSEIEGLTQKIAQQDKDITARFEETGTVTKLLLAETKKLKQAEETAKQAEAKAKQAEAKLKQAEQGLKQAEETARQTEAKLKQADHYAKQAEDEKVRVLSQLEDEKNKLTRQLNDKDKIATKAKADLEKLQTTFAEFKVDVGELRKKLRQKTKSLEVRNAHLEKVYAASGEEIVRLKNALKFESLKDDPYHATALRQSLEEAEAKLQTLTERLKSEAKKNEVKKSTLTKSRIPLARKAASPAKGVHERTKSTKRASARRLVKK